MGICPQQHRVVIGMFNGHLSKTTKSGNVFAEDNLSFQQILIYFLCVAGFLIYVYLLLLLMALFIENTLNNKFASLPATKYYPNIKLNSYRELINIVFFYCFILLSKKRYTF